MDEADAPHRWRRRMPSELGPLLAFAVLALLCVWTVFWVIRLAKRYGMQDALTIHRDWLTSQRGHDAGAG